MSAMLLSACPSAASVWSRCVLGTSRWGVAVRVHIGERDVAVPGIAVTVQVGGVLVRGVGVRLTRVQLRTHTRELAAEGVGGRDREARLEKRPARELSCSLCPVVGGLVVPHQR